MTYQQREYDLIIVGTGLVGLSLALSLQHQGLKIAVLEKYLPDAIVSTDQSFRPISLAHGSVEIFKTLQIWSALQSEAAAIRQVVVCEQGSLGAVHFKAQEMKVEALGYVVPFAKLNQLLYQKVVQLPGVEIISSHDIIKIEHLNEHVHVLLETYAGPRELQATLIVGCDGAESQVRQLLNIGTLTKDEDSIAQTAIITLEKPFSGVAVERFTATGVLAVLPTPHENQCGLVFTMSKEIFAERQSYSTSEWITLISQELCGRIGKITDFIKGGTFPLQTVIAKKQILPGVVLLGNAAHTIYPLAAQGFNLSLRDVAVLSEILVSAKQQLLPLGSVDLLQRYLDWRLEDQMQITRLTERISRFFSIRLPGAAKIRGLGLLALDLLMPLKRRFATVAMGMMGKLPKLVRGLPLWQEEK